MNELKEYYKMLLQKAVEKSVEYFFNEDKGHNAIVMQVMLEHAKNIKMYCGELSIFRKEFAENVYKDHGISSNSDFDPIKGLYEALKKFLMKGYTLEAIIENPKGIQNEDIYNDLLKKYISKGQIKLYGLKNNYQVKPNAFHFTIGNDYMYRREIDKDKRGAIGCFNDRITTGFLSDRYANYKQHAILI